LVPTLRKRQPVAVDEPDELTVMLYFVFKQVERKLNLLFSQGLEIYTG
jgi:hypothetical protein